MAFMHKRKFKRDEADDMSEKVKIAIKLLERDCPLWLSNITTHILSHIAEKVRESGPMYTTWMYPFERLNCFLTRRVLNRSKIEECLMETMQVSFFSYLANQ